jgi:hypothetical protein
MPGGWPVAPAAQAQAPAGYAWPQPAYAWPSPATDAPRAYTAYPYPIAHAAAGHPKVRLAHRGLILTLVSLIAVSVVIVVAAAATAKTPTPPSCRLVVCAQPQTGPPVVSGTVYTSSTYGFSVTYQGEAGTTAAGVQLGFDFKGPAGTDTLAVLGQPASGQDAQAVVQSIESSQFPNAVPDYTIPGAYVGYQLGYGVAFDVWSNNADGSQSKQRVLLMAAVRGNLAIVVLASGPYLVLTPQNGFASKPTGADLPVAAVADPIVNSITWPSS